MVLFDGCFFINTMIEKEETLIGVFITIFMNDYYLTALQSDICMVVRIYHNSQLITKFLMVIQWGKEIDNLIIAYNR